ncbi:MAG: hypothetical protein AOA65_0260 [Candidatus Bathyarchaeota archaeon BA1]|nr:MAG: hypothetical protein AOA65_0260 [Candidatus Bathyarchaeota archaeon BA1]
MSFVFETLSEKDLDQCVNVILSSMGEKLLPIHRDKETIKRLIYGAHVLTLVAKRGNRIVGLISGTMLIPPNIGFLDVADDQSAREGLGEQLIDKFLEAVKKRLPKAPFIATTLATDNTGGISLYSGKGFMIEGFIKEGMMGKDVVLLRKRL